MSDTRQQEVLRQGTLARVDSGRIGGGGCYVDDQDRPTVILAVIPEGTDGEDLHLRQGDTFQLGDEVWEVTEIHRPGPSYWGTRLTRLN